ncbi:TonB-dependent receptor [Spirosoma gilvum]
MKYACLFLVVLLSICPLKAQSVKGTGSVQGTLVDSLTGKPIPFATVSLIQRDKLVDGTVSDSLGQFRLTNLLYGTYSLRFGAVGYRPSQTPVWTVDSAHLVVQTDSVRLTQDIRNLNAVTVRGQKPLIENRVDGINFNVESLPSIAGSNASDILRRVPLLSVDANGGLSMRGSTNIRVFIDGKPSDIYAPSVADALKVIPGESIVKVEVITHPSARYDAEGTDGVVNIITRKIRENITNGTFSGVLGNRNEQLMGNVQSKTNKWLLKMDGFYQTYWNRNGSVLDRESGLFRVIQHTETHQTGNNIFGGANVLYSLDSLHTINVGYRLRWTPNETQATSANFNVENGLLLPSFHRQIITPLQSNGHVFTSGYTGMSRDKRKELSLLATYFRLNNTNQYEVDQTSTDQTFYREDFYGLTRNRDLILQADYSHTFRQNWKWETGAKLTQKYLTSDNQFGIYNFDTQQYRPDLTRANAFSYQSSVYALYANVNFQLKKWQFMTGVRYEQTLLQANFRQNELSIPSFHNLVPNLLISRNLNKKSTLKLGYTVKLVRPYYAYLNPTINNSDSLNIQFGNPYLQPEITRRYQLSYSRNNPKLFTDIALFYNHNRNSIETIRTARPDGVFETTWQNIGHNQRVGASIYLNWKPTPTISLGSTWTLQYVHLTSPVLQLSNAGLMRQWVLNYSQKLPKGYSLDVYGFFDVASINLQGSRTGWKYYSLTVSKKSANDRFNLSLRMDTPFTRYTFIDEETTTASFYQHYTYRYQNQNIRLTFSYKLGKKEIKSPRMRQAENPD